MLNKTRRTILSVILATVVACGIACAPAVVAKAEEGEKVRVDISDNEGQGKYTGNWAQVMCSYLCKTSGGYQTVSVSHSAMDNSPDVKINYYGSDYSYLSSKTVKAELPKFGGFYEGKNSYFLVFGQENLSEDNNKEVVRVVRYDKNWNRVGSASLYGANTWIPFEAGSLRMAECGGYLYIRTCHEMYASSDGLHHQAALSIQVRESDMQITDSFYRVWSGGFYSSHSFNQFVIVDDENHVIALDHGDAYPRSAVLVKSLENAANCATVFNSSTASENTMIYYGETGANFTGAILGGLTYSSTNYLGVGASVDQSADTSGKRAKNVYVSVTGRDSVGDGNTQIKWISTYTEDSGRSATDVKIVKAGSDKFLVAWSEKSAESDNVGIKYVFVNGEGNAYGLIYSANNASLSDCQPVLDGNKVVWYVSDGESVKFNTIDMNGKFSSVAAKFPANADIYPKNVRDCYAVVDKFGPLYSSDSDNHMVVMHGDRVLVEGKDYTSSISSRASYSDGTIAYLYRSIKGIGDFYGSEYMYLYPVPDSMEFQNVDDSDSSVTLYFPLQNNILGYEVERSLNKGPFQKIGEVTDVMFANSLLSFTDKDVVVGNYYTYRFRPYSTNGTERIYGGYSQEHTLNKVPTPTPTEKVTPTPVEKLSIKLDSKSIKLVCGDSHTLEATVTGTTEQIIWNSSDGDVALVDRDGTVTAKQAGQATIRAIVGGIEADCTVTVLYKDVTNSKDFWYKPTNYLTAKGVVKGYDKQTLFKPANECTRAQMVTFIWRLMGEPAPKAKTCKFSDVKKSDYFYKACIWGNEKHIVEGYKDGTFGPKIVCARKHAVTFLWRLADKPEPSSKKNKFSDVKKSDYFYKATLWASEKGILAGYSDGTFRPNGDCLRRQMVTFLYKYDKKINGKG